MAKTNYSFERRQRDLAKKLKREEKRQRKLAAKAQPEDMAATQSPAPAPPDAEKPPPGGSG